MKPTSATTAPRPLTHATPRATRHPAASRAGKIAAALFLVICLFQIGLAAGLPWGEAAFGGANVGVLPEELRLSSAISVGVYGALAAIAGTRLASAPVRRFVLYGAAGLMVVGALVNIASPSFVERIMWAPVTIALAILLWNAARDTSLDRTKASAAVA